MDKGRDKSRTPKDERKTKDHSQKEDKANAASKAAAKGAEKKTAGKRLEFTPEHEKKDERVTQPDESKQAAEVAAEKRTRFSESEEESSEARKSNISEEPKKTQASKSETPSMALTTLRMQDMTVSTPVRSDGTKTPLKMPPAKEERRRSASSHSISSSSDKPEAESEEERMDTEEISVEDLQKELRLLRKRQRTEQEDTNKRLDMMSQQLEDATYDVESHGRINAHLLQKKLQDDARNASLSLSIEGFPKDASEEDRNAFADWVLQQSKSKDRDSINSLMNTRGELSNIIVIKFSSGWHRN